MKKLTKKSLEELAVTMPLISEWKQKEYVGGYVYFDKFGNKLGEFGGGNSDIKIVDGLTAADTRNNFNIAQDAYSASLSTGSISSGSVTGTAFDITKFGTFAKNASEDVQGHVAEYYANNYCPAHKSFVFSTDSGVKDAAQSSHEDGELTVFSNNKFVFNENDMKSVMEHEQIHFLQDTSKFANNSEMEIDAMTKEAGNADYKNTSSNYKANQAKYLFDEWHTIDVNDPRTLKDACIIMGASYSIASKIY